MNWLPMLLGKHAKKGSVIVMMAAGMVFFVGLTSMVTDVGWMYYSKARLQGAVNAGWKAGYDRLQELGFPLDDTKKADIRQRVLDVIQQNGYTASQAASVEVTFPNDRTVEVNDTKNVDLFFAQVLNVKNATVAAQRGDLTAGSGGIVPLAIPWGIVKDLDRNTFTCELFDPNDPNAGFATGTEYIIRLGSGESGQTNKKVADPTRRNDNPKLILIPFDSQPNEECVLKAYGVAFWCLRILYVNSGDDAGDTDYTFPHIEDSNGSTIVTNHNGIEWLLGYHGGAFLLPYDDGDGLIYDDILAKCVSAGITYSLVEGAHDIKQMYTDVGDNVLKLTRPRPRIAVFSTSPETIEAETILQTAQIPYGTAQQTRTGAYVATASTRLSQEELLGGKLNEYVENEPRYTYLYTNHEDFTGMNGGCDNIQYACKFWDSYVASIPKTSEDNNMLCQYCKHFYFEDPGIGWGTTLTYDETQCYRKKRTPYADCKTFDAGAPAIGILAYKKTSSADTDLCDSCRNFYFTSTVGWTNVTTGSNRKYYLGNTSPSWPAYQPTCWIYNGGKSCRDWDSVRPLVKTASTTTDLCPYCRNHYFFVGTNNWNIVKANNNYNVASCTNAGLRCYDRRTHEGVYYRDHPENFPICSSDSIRLGCRGIAADVSVAAAAGYADDSGYNPATRLLTSTGQVISPNSVPGMPVDSSIVMHPGKVQKMKWAEAAIIRTHVQDGGHFMAMCFAPETFNLALWQKTVYDAELTAADAVLQTAYNQCLGFTGFGYREFFLSRMGDERYTDINADVKSSFSLYSNSDPRTQNSGSDNPWTDGGPCDSFNVAKLASGVTVLGSSDGVPYYVGGIIGSGTGAYTYLAGHTYKNTATKRLFLNTMMWSTFTNKRPGSTSTGNFTTVVGNQKSGYGSVDPDNQTAGGANAYRNWFTYGFNGPLEIGDRLMTENGNMNGPTDQSVDARVNGIASYPPAARIIVPITDVPPEVALNNNQNASATTIYELQGQDHPNGVYLPSQYAFGASVRIIGFAEFELIPVASYTRAGSDISSGDTGDLGAYQGGQVRAVFIRYIVKPGEVPIPY